MRSTAQKRARNNYYASPKGRKNRKVWDAAFRDNLKLEVLTLCGGGVLRCVWADCNITDIDMLSIDHVFNDGNKDCRSGGTRLTGNNLYIKIRREGNSEGRYQTLCQNHQWKKEILRRRALKLKPIE